MLPRQVWLFTVGCWVTFVTAAVHLVGQVLGAQVPIDDRERQVLEGATSYHFHYPGGAERSLMDFIDGFSLTFALLLATMGSVGLIVRKRGLGDTTLMTGVARTLAIGSAGLVVISQTHFFIVPTLFLALMTTCFTLAAVRAPQ